MPDRPDDAPETPPVIPSPHVQEPAQSGYGRRARKRKSSVRSGSGFYLPAWSVGVMLLLVFGIVAAIVTLLMTLGGQTAPGGEPHVVIITAEPSHTPETLPTSAAPTLAGVPVEPPSSTQDFSLQGPTLIPVATSSPTPANITVGATVIVNTDQLRIRPLPGLDNKEIFFANQGDRFTVVGGPQQNSGITWWQVQDPDDPTRKGWAAADYLDVATP